METTTSSDSDPYYAQDDTSEAIRRSVLVGDTSEDNPWYDANIHGDFSEDGS